MAKSGKTDWHGSNRDEQGVSHEANSRESDLKAALPPQAVKRIANEA